MPRKKSNPLLPFIALRGLMVFPEMSVSVDIGRPASVLALQAAMNSGDQQLIVSCQIDPECEEPALEDLYKTGTLVSVSQVMNTGGPSLRVTLRGLKRVELRGLSDDDKHVRRADFIPLESVCEDTPDFMAHDRLLRELLDAYAKVSMQLSPETLSALLAIQDSGVFADSVAANVLQEINERQNILAAVSVSERIEQLCAYLLRENELCEIEKDIQERVRTKLDKEQRDYFLREHIHAIQEEIGESDEDLIEELRQKAKDLPLNDEARDKVSRELDRMVHMPTGSPDLNVSRTYVEWILELPWGSTTEDNYDLASAREVLDRDHYGLKKVKERIIEYLAVRKMKQMNFGEDTVKGPILCFVGPPGVGKTSIVRGIAQAIGRKFIQMSLGGVRDEAEIRGHRRTYIGAIPGRIISGIKQAGTMNPVFLFDEIDKMSHDFRGDPASAMLEVLDSEQNNAFRDHYLEIPFDLSQVMFITTANSMDEIPAPLLDRLEIIEVPSYTDVEKKQIAINHLLPRIMTENGVKKGTVRIQQASVAKVIDSYTREAGVRELNRVLSQLVRKSAVDMLTNGKNAVQITPTAVEKYLGAPKYIREAPEKEPRIGIVNGLAYTTVGGEILQVECAVMPGSGQLQLTGHLGDVMKESAQAARSYIRAHAGEWELRSDFYKDLDIHIHVPEGAVPKDGPSAGVTLITALLSVLSGQKVRQDLAMTGEITLRGRVLPIGGLKEKLLAAYRFGIKTVLVPRENLKDLEEIPADVLNTFEVIGVDTVGDVLSRALLPKETER